MTSVRQLAHTAELWARHRDLLESQAPSGLTDISDELLTVKGDLALAMSSPCRLCARNCRVDRLSGERGYCGVGWPGFVGEEHIHFGELDDVIPTHSVFFSGCTMHCIYCRKMALVQDPEHGVPFDPAELALTVEDRRLQGARTLKLLGGTPEPQLAAVFEMLRSLPTRLPLVWETTLYVPREVVNLLVGVVDVLVCNVRYAEEACAQRYSDAPGYPAIARKALEALAGRIRVSLRHLVLPGHIECCTAGVARMMQETFPDEPLMLLTQYAPFGDAIGDPVLGRSLTADEAQQALAVARANKELVELWPMD